MSFPLLDRVQRTAKLRLFGLVKIPMLWWLRPTVLELSHERCVVRIPLGRRSHNHLGSMYFGALCAGADTAGGLIAMELISERDSPVVFVFKDLHANFLKRAHGDVHFRCEDGLRLRELVMQAEESGERVEETVHIVATCPSQLGDEPVAEFELTISLKRRS